MLEGLQKGDFMAIGTVGAGYRSANQPYPSKANTERREVTDYQKLLQEKREELVDKIRKGEMEPSFQIGTQSFTLKEWKRFMDKFDNTEKLIKEELREEGKKSTKTYF